MRAKILDIPVGTEVRVGDVMRSFTPPMTLLVGQYVNFKTDEESEEWFGMEHEYADNLFVFHKDWVEFCDDMPEPELTRLHHGKFTADIPGGYVNISALRDISLAVNEASCGGDFGMSVKFPNIMKMAEGNKSWLKYHDGKAIDQRYRDWTRAGYGVQVPDAICEIISKGAKKHMTQARKTTMIVGDKDSFTHWWLRYMRKDDLSDMDSKKDWFEKQRAYPIHEVSDGGETTDPIMVAPYRNWLVLIPLYDSIQCRYYPITAALAIVDKLGKDKYSWKPIDFGGEDFSQSCVAIYKIGDAEPSPVEKYMEALYDKDI